MNGTYNIIHNGKQVGKLKVYSEGLRTVFLAETAPLNGVSRLAVVSNGKTIPVGVLSPTGKGLYIKKSFSKNSLAEMGVFSIDEALILAQEAEKPAEPEWGAVSDPGERFTDPDLKSACKGARGVLIRENADAAELAFPVRTGMTFALMPAFCLGRPLRIDDKDYLIFSIKNGNISV